MLLFDLLGHVNDGAAYPTLAELGGRKQEDDRFLAERIGDDWQVSLEGEPGFAIRARRAPMLAAAEAQTLAGTGEVALYANGDYRTGMRLPYKLGTSWYLTGGPHGSPVRNAVDLAGGDRGVRAVRAGKAYTMCRGWVRGGHDRGYATDHYPLWSNVNGNGAAVSSGSRSRSRSPATGRSQAARQAQPAAGSPARFARSSNAAAPAIRHDSPWHTRTFTSGSPSRWKKLPTP